MAEHIRRHKITVHAVAGLIMRDGKLLVAERPQGKPYSGYWEFPGGKVEVGEDSLSAMKRELREEIGVEAVELEHWFDHLHAYPDKTVLLELWRVKDYRGEPKGQENQELRWVDYDEMMHLQLLEGNLAIISEIKPLFTVDS